MIRYLDDQDEALQTNAADEDQVRRAEDVLEARAQRALALMRQQLSTLEGREFVWNELQRHGIWEDVVGSVEHVYAFLGRRREGLRLFADVNKHPELYLEMQREALDRAALEAAQNAAARTRRREENEDDEYSE